jgi:hypothetical protein
MEPGNDFFGIPTPVGYKTADEAAISAILRALRALLPLYSDVESLEGAIALETLAQEIRQKVAKGG